MQDLFFLHWHPGIPANWGCENVADKGPTAHLAMQRVCNTRSQDWALPVLCNCQADSAPAVSASPPLSMLPMTLHLNTATMNWQTDSEMGSQPAKCMCCFGTSPGKHLCWCIGFSPLFALYDVLDILFIDHLPLGCMPLAVLYNHPPSLRDMKMATRSHTEWCMDISIAWAVTYSHTHCTYSHTLPSSHMLDNGLQRCAVSGGCSYSSWHAPHSGVCPQYYAKWYDTIPHCATCTHRAVSK